MISLRQFFPMTRITVFDPPDNPLHIGDSVNPAPISGLRPLAAVVIPEVAANPHIAISVNEVARRFSSIPDQPDVNLVQTANPTQGDEPLTVTYSQRADGTSPVVFAVLDFDSDPGSPTDRHTVGPGTKGEINGTFTFASGDSFMMATCVVATKHGASVRFGSVHITVSKPTPTPPPPVPPSITVTFKGPTTSAEFTVKGTGFLHNLPGTFTSSVLIKAVNTNNLAVFSEHTKTNNNGEITSLNGEVGVVIKGDISGLPVNAAGQVTIAFSATDGRKGPTGPGLDGLLWSNPVRLTFS